jgi:hypothetical protein
MPAAVMGDMCTCVGPPDTIIMGSTGVMIGGKPAARMGDPTVHGGVIMIGCPTVLIGETMPGGPQGPIAPFMMNASLAGLTPGSAVMAAQIMTMKLAAAMGIPFCEKCLESTLNFFTESVEQGISKIEKNIENTRNLLVLNKLAKSVNPDNGNSNCGKIIDAVIARIKDPDSTAVADIQVNGSFPEIEKRHNVQIKWGKSFKDAFNEVKKGGDGTIGIVGVVYGDEETSHVIVITNKKGVVAIIEGQGGGKAISSPDEADRRYNSDGKSNIGLGILNK